MPTIRERVETANQGDNPNVILRLKSGWVVVGDRQPLEGYCMLMADPVVEGWNSLSEAARAQYALDMCRVGDALMEITGAYRINYETWCNVDQSLHTHITPRFMAEPEDKRRKQVILAYDGGAARAFDPARDAEFMRKMRAALERFR